jgi:hypothetical protein
MALAVQLALTAELTNQSFAAQETSHQALTRLADLKLKGVLKGNNVAGINDVFSTHVDTVNRAKAVE